MTQALISLSTGKKENTICKLLVESGQIYLVLAATCDILYLTFACGLSDNRKHGILGHPCGLLCPTIHVLPHLHVAVLQV